MRAINHVESAAIVTIDRESGRGNDRLKGWKEIAAALQVSVRTAQRWHCDEGMPVHYHRHGERSTAWASLAEIDRWREQRMQPPRPEPQTPDEAAGAAVTGDVGSAPIPSAPMPVQVGGPRPPPGHRLTLLLAGVGVGIGAAALMVAVAALGARGRPGPLGPSPPPAAEMSVLQAPQHVYLVLKRERRNAFLMRDLVTGQSNQEWRFCPRTPGYTLPFYPGFIITKLKVVMTGDCMFFDDTDGDMEKFVIARGRDREGADPNGYLYRDATYEERVRFPNWLARPVLWHGCVSSSDDADVSCDVAMADFGNGVR